MRVVGVGCEAVQRSRRVVFAALSGEMWGRLGSQRLAEEMAAQGPAALDVPVSDLWALMDIGMAGLPTHASNGAAQFAAHVPPTSATSLAQPSAVLAALNAHATGGGGGVTLTTAEGLPSLSAAHAFLSNPAFASVPALHLSDYASRLRYDAFASSYDSACPGDCFVYGTDRTVLGYSGLPATGEARRRCCSQLCSQRIMHDACYGMCLLWKLLEDKPCTLASLPRSGFGL